MPVIENAKRALRGSERKRQMNDLTRTKFEVAVRVAKKEKSKKTVSAAFSQVDKAAKKNVIHKNRAARIKSRLAKLIASK